MGMGWGGGGNGGETTQLKDNSDKSAGGGQTVTEPGSVSPVTGITAQCQIMALFHLLFVQLLPQVGWPLSGPADREGNLLFWRADQAMSR